MRRLGVLFLVVTGTAVAVAAPTAPAPPPACRTWAPGGSGPGPAGGTPPPPVGPPDPPRLSRTAVQVSDGNAYFVRKARGGMVLEDTIRRAVNRVRYRTAVG